MPRQALLALTVMVVVVIGVAAAIAFFVARDDATVPGGDDGPGSARTDGDTAVVAAGNVMLIHSDERLTRGLRELAAETAGSSDPALEAAGQAVLVRRRPNLDVPVLALSSSHRLEARGPDDPALRRFIEYWLGREP
jgi:hypothetical protein